MVVLMFLHRLWARLRPSKKERVVITDGTFPEGVIRSKNGSSFVTKEWVEKDAARMAAALDRPLPPKPTFPATRIEWGEPSRGRPKLWAMGHLLPPGSKQRDKERAVKAVEKHIGKKP